MRENSKIFNGVESKNKYVKTVFLICSQFYHYSVKLKKY